MRTTIGGYRLGRKLGLGRSGAVYTARHPGGDRVALKVTLRSLEHTSAARASLLENEIATMRRLEHPSLVDVHDAGFTPDGRLYVAMELVSGEPLESALARRGRLPVSEAVELVAMISGAIAECHDAGLLHLDLRPRNIIVTDRGKGGVKILDAGLAGLGASHRALDVLPYLSPERFETASPDRSDDLYALGVIFYELLTGHPPHGGEHAHQIYGAKCKGTPRPASELVAGVSPAIDRVIDHLLRVERTGRPSSARWLSRELCKVAGALNRGGPRAGDHASVARFHLAAGVGAGASISAKHLRLAIAGATLMPRGGERDRLLSSATFELVAASDAVGDTAETLARVDHWAAELDRPTREHRVALEASYARVFLAAGDLARATRHGGSCLDIAAGNPGLTAYTLAPLLVSGLGRATSGAFGPAAEVLGRAADLAHAQGEWVWLAHATSLRGLSLAYTGDYEQAHCWVDRGIEIAERVGDASQILCSLFAQAALGEAQHDTELGLRASEAALQIAAGRQVDDLYLFLSTLFAGRHQFHAGNLSHATLLLTGAFDIAARLELGVAGGWSHAFLGDCLFVGGDIAAAERCYELAIETAGDEYSGPAGLVGQAHCLARRGAERRDIGWRIQRALARLERAGNTSFAATVLDRATMIWADRGDIARAQRAEREAADAFALLGVLPRSWSPIGGTHPRPRRTRRARTIVGTPPPASAGSAA